MNIHWNPCFWKISFPSPKSPLFLLLKALDFCMFGHCQCKCPLHRWSERLHLCAGSGSGPPMWAGLMANLCVSQPGDSTSPSNCVGLLPCFCTGFRFVWFWFGFEIHIFSSVFLYSFREVIPSYQMFFLCCVVAESTGGNGQWLEMGMNQTCSALLWM